MPDRIADVFAPVLASHPGREALVTRRGRWTYRELDDAAATAAAVLSGLGVKAGDRVAAALPNEADIIFAFHGAMRIGAIWVGINQALAAPEKAFLLADSEALSETLKTAEIAHKSLFYGENSLTWAKSLCKGSFYQL